MAEVSSSPSVSDLLCEEDSSFMDDDQEPRQQDQDHVDDDEDEYIEAMVKRESFVFLGFDSQQQQQAVSCSHRAWLDSARSNALDWIFNTRAKLGFNVRTLYLSITYFDRFLSKQQINDDQFWAIRLLSIACLSIAAKIEESYCPMLSQFPVEDYRFESKSIQRMELLVLSGLEWKMVSLTPFSYLNYFANKFGAEQGSVSNAVELVLAMTKETKLTGIRPSIVAASAVLVTFEGQLTRDIIELKSNVIKFWRSQDMEDVHSCCDVLKEIEKRKAKTPQLTSSPNVVPMNSRSHYRLGINTAKRRLSLNDSDHDNPEKKDRWT